MKDYFFFELRQLLKSKKTIGLFCLLLIYSGVYSFWQRDFRPIERVDKTEMQQRYTVRQDFLDQQAANPSDHWSAFMAVEMFTPWNEAEKQRLDALAEKDWQAYAQSTSTWYHLALQFTDERNIFYTPDYYTFRNYYAGYDGRFGYASTAKLMEAFSQLPNSKLSQAVMEQKTGVQALQRSFTEYLPILLIAVSLFLAIDCLPKERRHKSLFLSLPLSTEEILWSKTAALMVGSAIATLGTMFFIWFGSGIQFGFGSLELPVTILSSTFDARYPITDFNAFETQAIGLFLSQCFLATLFLQFLYCRGILLFSTLFRSELINLLVSGFCLLSPFLFQRRWFSAYLDKTLYVYLYQNVGQVLSGWTRFYFGSEGFTMEKGLLLLGGVWLLIELCFFLTIQRKKFHLA